MTNYTEPLGNLTTFVRDVAERIVYQTNAENQLLQFVYNSADELAMLIDGKSQTNIWLMMPMDASPTKLMRWERTRFHINTTPTTG